MSVQLLSTGLRRRVDVHVVGWPDSYKLFEHFSGDLMDTIDAGHEHRYPLKTRSSCDRNTDVNKPVSNLQREFPVTNAWFVQFDASELSYHLANAKTSPKLHCTSGVCVNGQEIKWIAVRHPTIHLNGITIELSCPTELATAVIEHLNQKDSEETAIGISQEVREDQTGRIENRSLTTLHC